MKSLSTALGTLLIVALFAFGIYLLHIVREKRLADSSTTPVENKKKNDSKAENESINRSYEQSQRSQN
jgi:hypothetical protein